MNENEKKPRLIRSFVQTLIRPKIPMSLVENHRGINQKSLDVIGASLRQHYFTQEDSWYSEVETYLSSDEGQQDLRDHLHSRLDTFRSPIIPWLNDAKPLSGAKILEIGCGTGSSSVALAEQGAEVTAVDIVESSLIVAKDRCDAYGLNVNFFCVNSMDVHKVFEGQHFDFIIFFATLEHMTHDERMIAMKNTWDMLPPGSLWCVVDTPNRLWYFDSHTSQIPFFQWLPDDLALLYSKFSPRKRFCDLYREVNNNSKLDFLRRGRGVSFHEFDLTMKRVLELDVISCLQIFLSRQTLLGKFLWNLKDSRRFESVLMRFGPKIHRGFYQEYLNLIIRKT